MRNQFVDYDNFDLISLIEEMKTRIEPPFKPNDTLHGIIIVGKDYYGICKELREFLERDDLKGETKIDLEVGKNKCDWCSCFRDYKDFRCGNGDEEIFYDSKTNKYILVLEQFRCEYATLEIKYCPICGRKL